MAASMQIFLALVVVEPLLTLFNNACIAVHTHHKKNVNYTIAASPFIFVEQ